MNVRVLSLAMLSAVGCASAPNIAGHWVSLAVETRSGAGGTTLYLRRDFITSDSRSQARFDFYEDAGGQRPSISVWLDGPYTLTGPWAAVPGSWAGEFKFAALKITPRTQATTDYLNSGSAGSCGKLSWQLGVEQDASDTGCQAFGIDLVNKSIEYDIVKRDGDQLFYGARPADGSGLDRPDKRPTALQVPLQLAP